MPQPLSNLPQVKSIHMVGAPYKERPRHMEAASKIITAASISDHWMTNVVVSLSPQNATRLAHHLISLDNDAKKTAAFEAIASVLLPQDMHELLRLIVSKHRSANKLRQPFAHHRFGFTEDVEDLLLLIDPRRELIDRAKNVELDANPPKTQEERSLWLQEKGQTLKELRESIMAYTLTEMENILKTIEVVTRNLNVDDRSPLTGPPATDPRT
jgi:hypothetical protein